MNTTPEEVAASLQKHLNSHGHAFQQAVLRRIKTLTGPKRSHWTLIGSEFPVTLNGTGTHADIVLWSSNRDVILVGECKRANPSHSHWAFAKAPPTQRPAASQVILEQFETTVDYTYTGLELDAQSSESGPFHLSASLKSGQSGDQEGQSVRQIDEAISQLFRATSGYIHHFFARSSVHLASKSAYPLTFVPVIFTTAKLWVTDCDIGTADLTSGNLDAGKIQLQPVDWLWFNHNRSQLLSHEFQVQTVKTELETDLERLFTRSLAVVSVSGIERFLSRDLLSLFES